MNFQINMQLSFALVFTMTSLHSVTGTHFMRAATKRNQAVHLFDREVSPLLRKTRSTRRYAPCVLLTRIADIKNQFDQWMDKDQNGRANFTEVRGFLQTLKKDVSDDVINFFIARRDQNGNGQIDLIPEYLQEIVGNDYGSDAAREWFYLHDSNDDGYVSKQELVQLGQVLGMSPQQAEDTAMGYYLPLDIDGDGKLSYEEFKQIYEPPQMPTV